MSDQKPVRIYDGPERRGQLTLSSEQIEIIAEHAAEKAVVKMKDEFFKEFGRKAFQFVIWLLGALLFAGFLWANAQGLIKW